LRALKVTGKELSEEQNKALEDSQNRIQGYYDKISDLLLRAAREYQDSNDKLGAVYQNFSLRR
jgi:hypothetical protein